MGGSVGGWLDIGWDLVYLQECLLNSFSFSSAICWHIEIVFLLFLERAPACYGRAGSVQRRFCCQGC